MAGIGDFINAVNSLGSAAQSGQQSLSALQATMNELQGMQSQAQSLGGEATRAWADNIKAVADQMKAVIAGQSNVLKGAKDISKEYEQFEQKLKKSISPLQALTNKSKDLAQAWKQLNSGDLGKFVASITAGIPVVGQLGGALGLMIQATISATDAQVHLRKAVIDGQAAAGRFAETMGGQIQQNMKQLNVEMAAFGAITGVGMKELTNYVGQLGKMGFSLEEIGIDETSGDVTSLTDSLSDASKGFGLLSSGIGLARLTGQSTTQVFAAMQFQMKEMGDTAEDTVQTMTAISMAARQAGVSAEVLAPAVRRMQEQFKFLGLDSTKAALQMGDMAAAAEKIGLGPQAAVGLFGQAAGGLAGQNFGMQTFLGQQTGAGGGLSAGFKFRQQVGESPLDAARGVVSAIEGIFGGRHIGVEEAKRDEGAAAMRLAQEQMTMKTFGLNQLQAARMLDATHELKNLGEGDEKRADELRKEIEHAQRSEKDYAAKTLTVQERMAKYMELLTKIVAKAMLTFLKSMGITGTDELSKVLNSIGSSGEIPANFDEKMRGAMKGLDTGLNKFAESMGSIAGALSKHMLPLIGLFASGKIFKALGGMSSAGESLTSIFKSTGKAAGALKMGFGAVTAAFIGWEIGTLIDQWTGASKAIRNWKSSVEKATIVSNNAILQREREAKNFSALTGMGAGTAGDALFKRGGARGLATPDLKTTDVGVLAQGERELTRRLQAYSFGGSKEGEKALEGWIKKAQKGEAINRKELSKVLREMNPGAWRNARNEQMTAMQQSYGSRIERESAIAQAMGNWEKLVSDTANQLTTTGAARNVLSQRQGELQGAWKGKRQSKDAWDISNAGWLYASPGDVVIDAASLGQAMSSGERGAGVSKLFEGVSASATGNIFGGGTGGGGAAIQTIPIKVVLDIVEDKLGLFVNKQITFNVAQDKIQPGKRGAAQAEQNSHSESNEVGS